MSPSLPPRAKRSLGQNFLVNAGVVEKILAALAPTESDWVVELGPGAGALTKCLSARCAHLIAVEMDETLAAQLLARVERPERLELCVQDGAHFDYPQAFARAGRPLLVTGNLPFNAATALLRRALEWPQAVSRLVLMFQREVAQRLVARPGSRTYGRLSVVTQQRARLRRLFDVSPGSFRPVPRVSATVLLVEPRKSSLDPCCLTVHDQLLGWVFAHRRKTLQNGLRQAPWPLSELVRRFEAEGIDPSRRAETVSVAEFARLARRLCLDFERHGASGRGDRGESLDPR